MVCTVAIHQQINKNYIILVVWISSTSNLNFFVLCVERESVSTCLCYS